MAKISRIKARKEYTCSKCRKTISVGEVYCKGTPFRRKPIIRCASCGLSSWELSSSEFVQSMGDLIENWIQNKGIYDGVWEDVSNELETIKSDCEERFDNIPEQLQDGDAGSLLQERIESLESAICELEELSMDDIVNEAYDNLDSDFAKEIKQKIGNVSIEEAYCDFEQLGDDCKAVNELVLAVKDLIVEKINDVLSEIDY